MYLWIVPGTYIILMVPYKPNPSIRYQIVLAQIRSNIGAMTFYSNIKEEHKTYKLLSRIAYTYVERDIEFHITMACGIISPIPRDTFISPIPGRQIHLKVLLC